MGRELGVTERQLLEISRYETSDAFDDDERLVLELAVAMTDAPVEITPELRARLDARFSEKQLVELASNIAWENYRGRFNRVFGVRPAGFSDGASCAVPEHRLNGPRT